jgi:hypothetical protein
MRSESASGNGHRIGHNEISIGMLCAEDAGALERVAQRDSSRVPTGAVLGARVNGELVAAVSVRRGDMVADPFVPTAGVRQLLAERAAQLRGDRAGGRLGRLLGRRGAAHAGSPAGAGGELLRI